MKKKASKTKKTTTPDAVIFNLYFQDNGDPSVGIPSCEGPISISLPIGMVLDEQFGEFELGLRQFLQEWAGDGYVQASWEIAEEATLCRRA